jgi:TolA-binding protein
MRHAFITFAAMGSLMVGAAPAAAQSVPVEARVDRLEKEMHAVQRKVFPAGVPVEADISSAPAAVTTPPSSSPVSDLIARVDALESQLATLTGQVEQNGFRVKKLEDDFAKYKADTDARLPAASPVAAVSEVSTTPPAAAAKPAVAAKPTGATPPRTIPASTTAAKPVATTAAPKTGSQLVGEARKTAVAAIEMPDTGNAADDSYNYGYRLWAGKFYPEAQVQLKTTIEKYGAGAVGSKAQNLLGRAYLDDGKPALASVAFYENYQKRPRGERAPDSLAWLGEALIQLKKPADACKVYGELEQAYGAKLSATLQSMMEKGRVRAKCGE